MRYTPIKRAKKLPTSNAGKDTKQQKLSFTGSGNAKRRISGCFLQKQTVLPFDVIIALLSIYPVALKTLFTEKHA